MSSIIGFTNLSDNGASNNPWHERQRRHKYGRAEGPVEELRRRGRGLPAHLPLLTEVGRDAAVARVEAEAPHVGELDVLPERRGW